MKKTNVPLAVFDFDGTIIQGDSFLPFMRHMVGEFRYYRGIVRIFPWLTAYALGRICNRTIKEKVVSCFLKGKRLQEIEQRAYEYALEYLPKKEKPEMRDRMQWHLEESHSLLLASASLLVYLKPWAEYRGFHGVCGAELEVDQKGIITGKIKGNNGFGPEKLEAVHDWLDGKNPSLTYAYGDSQGDRELLDWADVKIFRGKVLDN